MTDDPAEILFQTFLREATVSRFGMKGAGRPLLDVVHPTFPLLTTASPTLQGVLKDDFGEVVVACDMMKQRRFPSLDSCQKRFLWTHKEIGLAPYPVVGTNELAKFCRNSISYRDSMGQVM